MIQDFRGTYHFLSNFYETPVKYNGETYLNTEACFQAQKTLSDKERKMFVNLTASESKRLGRRVKLREDWEEIKDQLMYEIVKNKFMQHDKLREKLLATGSQELVEGNTWGDTYWGVCNGTGKNKLGTILMRVREELK